MAFDLFFAGINILLDHHTHNDKLSEKDILLRAKPCTNNSNIQFLAREHDRLFKWYWNESKSILLVAKHHKYKNAQNLVIFKVTKSEKKYYQNYFQKHLWNIKETWDGIKSIVTLKSKY